MHDHTFSLPSSMQMQRDATQCFGAFHPFITSNAPSFPFTCSPFNLSTPTSAPAPTPLPLPHPNAFCFAHDTRKTAPILQHRCKNAHAPPTPAAAPSRLSYTHTGTHTAAAPAGSSGPTPAIRNPARVPNIKCTQKKNKADKVRAFSPKTQKNSKLQTPLPACPAR